MCWYSLAFPPRNPSNKTPQATRNKEHFSLLKQKTKKKHDQKPSKAKLKKNKSLPKQNKIRKIQAPATNFQNPNTVRSWWLPQQRVGTPSLDIYVLQNPEESGARTSVLKDVLSFCLCVFVFAFFFLRCLGIIFGVVVFFF